MVAALKLPMNARDLVPHRGTMLLIDELTEYTPDRIVGRAAIAASHPFLDEGGRLNGACFVELMAQLAAAGEGYEAMMANEAVKSGFLVGVGDFSIHKPLLAGGTLDLVMEKTFKMGNVTVLEGRAFLGDELLAGGSLRLFVAQEAAEVPSVTETAAPRTEGNIHDAVEKRLSSLEVLPEVGRRSCEFRFEEDFLGFDGHFPGNPVLPGVVMIEMVMALCEKTCRNALTLVKIERAKYSGRVLPGEVVRVDAKIDEEGCDCRVAAKLTSEGRPVADLTLLVAGAR